MTRSTADLHAQHMLLRRWLESCFADEEAASLAPRPTYGPRAGRRGDPTPRFVGVVAARVDRLPPHLLRHAPIALRTLPEPEYLALLGHVALGLPSPALARCLRCHPRTVRNRVDRALTRLAHALWDDQFRPRAPPQTEAA